MNPFQRALSVAMKSTAAVAGQTITYIAGELSGEITGAVKGLRDHESIDENGATLRTKLVDWLIIADRLILDDQLVEPTPGHRIVETVGDTTITYEVQKLGEEGCYRLSGPSHDRYRIHTRQVPNAIPEEDPEDPEDP